MTLQSSQDDSSHSSASRSPSPAAGAVPSSNESIEGDFISESDDDISLSSAGAADAALAFSSGNIERQTSFTLPIPPDGVFRAEHFLNVPDEWMEDL
jgi:hypothetical protein